MYCINCGKKLDDNENQKFCPFCGYQIAGKEKEVSETVEKEDIKKAVQETIKESMAEVVKDKGKINYQPIELIMMLGIALATALLFSKWINVDVGMLRNFNLNDIPLVGWLFGLGYTNKISILSLIALSGELGLNGSDKFMMFAYIISVVLAVISLISFWSRGKAFYFSAIAFSIMMCVTSLGGLFFIKYTNELIKVMIHQLSGMNIGGVLFGDVFTANVFLFIEFGIGVAGIIVGIHTYRINKSRLLEERQKGIKNSTVIISSILFIIYSILITLFGGYGIIVLILYNNVIRHLDMTIGCIFILVGGMMQLILGGYGLKQKNLHRLSKYMNKIVFLPFIEFVLWILIASVFIWHSFSGCSASIFFLFFFIFCFPIIAYWGVLTMYMKKIKL